MRSGSTRCANWWNWASPGSGWDWNRRARVTPSYTARTRLSSRANCAVTASSCWARRSSAWSTTRPRISRICRTTLEGWKRYKADSDTRVRARFAWEARSLRDGYAAALWAMERHLRHSNPEVAGRVRALRQEVAAEFGFGSRVIGGL